MTPAEPASTRPEAPVENRPVRNVICIGTGWFPEDSGGLERVFYELHRHLPRYGWNPESLVTGRALATASDPAGIHRFAPADGSVLSRWRALRRRFTGLRNSDPDLIAAHFALYTFPLLTKIEDRPFVYHFHGPWASENEAEQRSSASSIMRTALERRVYRSADRCIVLSHAFKELLHVRYGVDAAQIEVVPGGVDADAFRIAASQAEARLRLGWPADRPVLLCVRRLVRRMGLENLVDAVGIAKKSVPEILVYVAGKGPLAQSLRRRIEEAGLSDHVKLLGFVPDDDLPYAYRAADLSIVPTVALEGFGLITLESLAAGTPVLVTPVGGLPETVGGLTHPLVLEGFEPHHLADGIVNAFTGRMPLPSPEDCAAHARENHDWSVIAGRVGEVYDAVLKG